MKPSYEREILGGKNVVWEILKAGRRKVYKVFWARKARDARSEELKGLILDKNIEFHEVHPSEITNMTGSNEHQGVAAQVSAFEYAELDEAIHKAKVDQKGGFLVLLDEIQDPHNAGALIRTSHLCGASGLILLKHRQVPVTNAVCKAAAGAVEWLPIVKEVNLVNVINILKNNGFYIYGASGEGGKSVFKEKFNSPMGLVLGSEGKGLRRLVEENCDALLTIPMEGRIGSFNVSVAAGILLGQILCQRHLSP